MKRVLPALLLSLTATTANADTYLKSHLLVTGVNIYDAVVIYDGLYRMWYGGWQDDSDYPTDRIFLRFSADNRTYGAPVPVMSPLQVDFGFDHVNHPSVSFHYNEASRQWQYTMFYTPCRRPCEQWDNEIWSAVSSDGVYWVRHQPLLFGEPGPAEPAAVIDPEPDGTFWKVYYVDRLDADNVKMARVDGDRRAMSTESVYQLLGHEAITGPEVRHFNGSWQLFFNVLFGSPLTRVDIRKVESQSNTWWPSGESEVVIENTGPEYCATMTPSVLPVGGAEYDLYFALTPRSADGTCDLTQQHSIHRWRMLD